MLGFSPLLEIPSEQLYSVLSPTILTLLGDFCGEEDTTVSETQAGSLAGDEVSNLNRHLLYGQTGFVRYPYIVCTRRTENGAVVIKREMLKVLVLAWFGDFDRGDCQLVMRTGLRDRRFDGTARADDCSLSSFSYSDPANTPQLIRGRKLAASSVELSVYTHAPGTRLAMHNEDAEFDSFVEQPFAFADRPSLFRELFDRAWISDRAPGQHYLPIADVANNIVRAQERIAVACGYDFMEIAASHYHVARWFLAHHYSFASAEQGQTIHAFRQAIDSLKETISLSRAQQSWLCVAQHLPSDLIPPGLNLCGPKWPQDNIGAECLWMYKPLNETAKQMLQPLA